MTCHHELIALNPIVMFATIIFFYSVIREKQLFTYNHNKQVLHRLIMINISEKDADSLSLFRCFTADSKHHIY